MNSRLKVDSPVRSFLVVLVLVIGGFTLIGPAVGIALATPFYSGNLMEDVLHPLSAPPDIFDALMIIQATAALLGLILLPLAYITLTEHQKISDLLTGRADVPVLAVVMLAGLCLQVLLSPVAYWNMHMEFPEFLKQFETWARQQEDMRMELTRLLTTFSSHGQFAVALLVIAVLPGIGEEFVFRGILQNRLEQITGNVHVAVWISAILFSAIHVQFFGFVPRMLLGAFFGYLYAGSGNLLVPVFAHFAHNAVTLLMIYLYQLDISDIHPDESEAAPLYLVIPAAIIFSGLLLYLQKLFLAKQKHEITG